MSESVNYIIEIAPSFQALEGAKGRPGGCTQDCPHCMFSENRPTQGVRTIDKRTLEAFYLTQLAVRQTCLTNRDTYRALSVTAGFPSEGKAPLFEPIKAPPLFTPQYVSFGFGDLSRISLADLKAPDIAGKLATYVPFQFNEKPKLRIDCRLPLRGLVASQENFEKAVGLGRNLLNETQGTSYPFNPHVFIYSETVNAHPRPADLVDPSKVEARRIQIKNFIDALFPEDSEKTDPIDASNLNPHIFSERHVVQHSRGVFIYLNRIIPRETEVATSLTGLDPKEIGISFFSDFVWINHSTYTLSDLTVRFNYEEYLEILKKSKIEGRALKELLESEILARRYELE